ncbi:unnamed protein product [Bursaphelenchus xylophilus]|uniref:(pine wood nematode) hypothetical protein n=1 Tax=Bursaphelenchus xylophilus TaxID=6326 RepID=A0A1I7RQE0_BURXY|nr:unnamed protein product [Bursaphelenchus xylophilus]CAG9104429.1 unnamed protein product [Bursaphelenchus xylophilus]
MDNVVVNNPKNPYPGKLYNHPSLTYNVYLGCVIDYNTTFTPETLKNVLIGNDTTGGPVLKTSEKDRIFFYFTDHGSDGVMFLPDHEVFTTADMDDALRQMTEKKMYKEMLFYIDCCYAGSIFEKVIPKYENILVITSSSPHQPAANTYCINDTGICLGAEFSVAWLEYDDTNSTSEHTLRDQLEVLKKRTTYSNVSVYGDVSILDRKISVFQGVQLPSTPVVKMDDVHYEYETVTKPEMATWRVGKMLERAIEAGDQQEVARLQSELVKLQNTPWPGVKKASKNL